MSENEGILSLMVKCFLLTFFFIVDYLAYNLVSVRAGVKAPNMNSIMERLFRTARREALESFLLTGKN